MNKLVRGVAILGAALTFGCNTPKKAPEKEREETPAQTVKDIGVIRARCQDEAENAARDDVAFNRAIERSVETTLLMFRIAAKEAEDSCLRRAGLEPALMAAPTEETTREDCVARASIAKANAEKSNSVNAEFTGIGTPLFYTEKIAKEVETDCLSEAGLKPKTGPGESESKAETEKETDQKSNGAITNPF